MMFLDRGRDRENNSGEIAIQLRYHFFVNLKALKSKPLCSFRALLYILFVLKRCCSSYCLWCKEFRLIYAFCVAKDSGYCEERAAILFPELLTWMIFNKFARCSLKEVTHTFICNCVRLLIEKGQWQPFMLAFFWFNSIIIANYIFNIIVLFNSKLM